MLSDLRYALRTLAGARGFATIAVACLALGIGANTTVFTAVNTLLLRPLPFADPDRVLSVWSSTSPNDEDDGAASYQDYLDLRAAGGPFAATALYTDREVNLGGVSEPERLTGARVTASLFPLLGVSTVLGRGIRPEEELGARVVVLSHGLWRRRFAADPGVVGTAIAINGAPHTVIGVLQPGINFPEISQLWLPLSAEVPGWGRQARGFSVVARLAPGATVEQARTWTRTFAAGLAARYPDSNRGWTMHALPYREMFSRELRPIMLVMLGAVSFVLLIACANVANLLLVRGAARQRELAVRTAVGASRLRIVRQLLAESLVIALLGGALGALLGTWGIHAIARTLPDTLPFWMVFDVDGQVIAFTFAVSLLASVVFGLVPALQASAPALTTALKDGGRGATAGARAGRLRSALVVSELALSLVLLAGATLMISSFLNLQRTSPGFDPAPLLTFETSLQGERYPDDSTLVRSYGAIIDRLERLPGVAAVGATSSLPVSGSSNWAPLYPEGRNYTGVDAPYAISATASTGYFAALGLPLLRGRVFDDRDVAGAPRVAVVNRTLAEREWGTVDVVGKRLKLDDAADTAWVTIVGVVPNVRHREPQEPDHPQIYRPLAQQAWRSLSLVIRASGDPAALAGPARAELRRVDRDLPVTELFTMREVVRRRMFQPRVYGQMFGAFAGAALLLASVGLYGVMSYSVAQRTHELGVRMALGARSRDVLALVVRQGGRLAALGLAVGLPAAFGLARLLRGMLYGVSASDPASFLGVAALLAGVALIACYIPARRATRVDPIVALRSD